MRYDKEKPTYEKIRNLPVLYLIGLTDETLQKIERKIHKEFLRAQLALKWIQGIRQVKKHKGGQNG